MKRFEEKLTNNITTAFDAFQEEVDPGAFKDIQTRLRKRKRRYIWFPWLMRGAATLAIAVGGFLIWQMFSDSSDNRQPVTDQEIAIVRNERNEVEGVDTVRDFEEFKVVKPPKTESYQTSSALIPKAGKESTTRAGSIIENKDKSDLINHPKQTHQEDDTQVTSHTADTDETKVPALDFQVLQPLPILTLEVISNLSKEPILIIVPEKVDHEKLEVRSESSFSLVAGVQTNVIRNQFAGDVGFKFGGTYQVPIIHGLGLTTGLMVSHVRLGFDPEPGTSFSLDSLEIDTSVDFPPPFEVEVEDWVDARLWSFEIPLHLNYSWRHTNGGYFRINAGLSSFWYIQQRFKIDRTVYTAEQDDISTSGVTITDIRKETVIEKLPTFQGFDAFSMFNFTFAFPIKLGSRHIYLEPYMQLPIGKQTSRSIRYGSAGIHFIFPIYHTKTKSK